MWRLVNMCIHNAYKLYEALVQEHTPGQRFLDRREAIQEMTHAFCQRGEAMRTLKAQHPAWLRDMRVVFATGFGKKIRSDAKGVVARASEHWHPHHNSC